MTSGGGGTPLPEGTTVALQFVFPCFLHLQALPGQMLSLLLPGLRRESPASASHPIQPAPGDQGVPALLPSGLRPHHLPSPDRDVKL